VGDQCVHFRSYDEEEFACLVSDYVSRELLKKGALNYPDKELVGESELKNKLKETYMRSISGAGASRDIFADVRDEFWESVAYGPVYVCCSCHQTWFRNSVYPVTDAFLAKVVRCVSDAALSDVLRWVCATCYRYLLRGKLSAACHLRYDPFSTIPEEL
jgi:hypothetical protein